MSRNLSVGIITSERVSNPSTDHIIECIDALNDMWGLGDVEKIVIADGFLGREHPNKNPHKKTKEKDYAEYLTRLQLIGHRKYKNNFRLVRLAKHSFTGRCILHSTLAHTKSFHLHFMHDFIPTRSIPINDICNEVENQVRKFKGCPVVRLNQHPNRTQPSGWNTMLLQSRDTAYCPLIKTNCWSENPSIFIRKQFIYQMSPIIQSLPLDMPLERLMSSTLNNMIRQNKEKGWTTKPNTIGRLSEVHHFFECYIYGKLGDKSVIQHREV